MIQGSGELITNIDEEGQDLPFLSTDEILKQLMKFGFHITYDIKKFLPLDTLSYLSQIYNLGYDKITCVALEDKNVSGNRIWNKTVIIFKSEFNDDLLTFGCKLTRKQFYNKLEYNTIIDVTHEKDLNWEWVTYTANIIDILNENVDPTHEFEPVDVSGSIFVPTTHDSTSPEELTPYESEVLDD